VGTTQRVVKGKTRWYILVYFYDIYGNKHRDRPTFNLNRIKDLKIRCERAEILRESIHAWLRAGFLYEDWSEHRPYPDKSKKISEKHITPVKEALKIAQKIKCNSSKENTNRSYKSHITRFIEWLDLRGMGNALCLHFTKAHALEYLDYYLIELRRSNVTHNNVLRHQRSIWNTLKDRGFVRENPFDDIKFLRKEKKKRRNFHEHEIEVILPYIYENDRYLFYAIILEYVCLIRPTELTFLKFYDVIVDEGIVVVSSEAAKNSKERYAIIPDAFRHFFLEEFWTKYPLDYFIFGSGGKPHCCERISKGNLYKRHKRILDKLNKSGDLKDISGLTLYSWKDTGITDLIDQLGLMAACDQAGHSKPDTTLMYRHRRRINKKMKGFQAVISVKNEDRE